MKMKKFFAVLLTVSLLFGCSSSSTKGNDKKSESLDAYAISSNKMQGKNVEMTYEGKMMVNDQSIDMKMDMIQEVKTKLSYAKINMGVSNQKVDMEMYTDEQNVYMKALGQWTKAPASTSGDATGNMNAFGGAFVYGEKVTKENLEKSFDNFKDVKYDEGELDGVKVYKIDATITMDELEKFYNEKNSFDKETKNSFEEMKKQFDDLSMKFTIYIPKDSKGEFKMTMTMDASGNKQKISMGPLDISIAPTSKTVVIPEEAKKATSSGKLKFN